ncbi:MAG TPA: CC/Se motif family (seleno)protein [Dissulfurispiraceae bacterium]|nr:CC/Se motif family (seleno)protein [Dissulfurispiraceae bacterium]
MLSISPEALTLIKKEHKPLFLDMPPHIKGGCCVNLQECPTVRFGVPHDPENYVEREIQGVPLLVPRRFPMDRELTITVSSFLGIRRIVLEGWNYC